MNLQPETLIKFRKINHLLETEKIDGDPITLKVACKRVGLSLTYYFKIRKFFDLGFKIEVEKNSGDSAKEHGRFNIFPA